MTLEKLSALVALYLVVLACLLPFVCAIVLLVSGLMNRHLSGNGVFILALWGFVAYVVIGNEGITMTWAALLSFLVVSSIALGVKAGLRERRKRGATSGVDVRARER